MVSDHIFAQQEQYEQACGKVMFDKLIVKSTFLLLMFSLTPSAPPIKKIYYIMTMVSPI